MKTSVKYLSDTKVEVTITLGAEELEAAEQVALTKIARDIKVPGFRKGKVPLGVAAKHVNPEALAQQSLDDALSKGVAEAFTSEKIQALERPAVEVKKFVPRSELEFTAESEVLPNVKLGDYKKLNAKREKAKVTKADINEIIERIQKGYAEKQEVERPAKDGDEVVIDFVGKKDDVPFEGGTANDYELVLGSGSFIEGFEKGIVGKKTGDTFDLPLTFPKTYHVEDLKGAKVVFTVTLNKIREIVLPPVDDDLAKKAGNFKTIADLEKDIEKEILQQKEKETLEKFKDALVTDLVAKSTVPVPQVLVDDQVKSIEQDMTQNLAYRGLTLDNYFAEKNYKDRDEWIEAEVKTAATDRVKAGLVLAELSKAEKVEATQEELLEKMNQLGQQYPDEKLRGQLKSPEVQRDIANRLLTDKTIDLLVAIHSK